MNCRDVERSLIEHEKSGAAPLPAQVQKHVLTCNRCAEFMRALNPSIMADAPAPEILRQLEDTLTAGLRPVRPLAPARYFYAAFAVIFILIVAAGVYRRGASGISAMSALTIHRNPLCLVRERRVAGLFACASDGARQPAPDLADSTAGCGHRLACASDDRFIPVPAREGLLGYWFGLSEGGWSLCVARGRAVLAATASGSRPFAARYGSRSRLARGPGHDERARDLLPHSRCVAYTDVALRRRSAGSIDRFSSRIRGRDCRKAAQTRPTLSSGLARNTYLKDGSPYI